MKNKIHPQYQTVTVSCACGNTFQTGSTRDSIQIEICSACHPFYTGKQKLIDTSGIVDKFKERVAKKEELKNRKGKTAKRKIRAKKKSQTDQ